MGRSPCCDADAGVKKGPWTEEEDKKLREHIEKNGCGSWRHLPKLAGLNRCSKSCRLRWVNYLRPDIKRGSFSEEEEQLIIHLHSVFGNKWSAIAAKLPGRTDNEIKNYWNTHLRKKLLMDGIDPVTHRPRTDLSPLAGLQNLIAAANLSNFAANPLIHNLRLQQTLIQLMGVQNLNPAPALMSSSNSLLHGNESVKPMNYSCSSDVDGSISAGSFMTATPANSGPSLASALPENWSAAQVNLSTASSSPTSTPFEAAGGGLTLDDVLDSDDLGWKDILDQISWSEEL